MNDDGIIINIRNQDQITVPADSMIGYDDGSNLIITRPDETPIVIVNRDSWISVEFPPR